ncbi:hypothetical protein ACJX0J_035106, partial [Zea mays]
FNLHLLNFLLISLTKKMVHELRVADTEKIILFFSLNNGQIKEEDEWVNYTVMYSKLERTELIRRVLAGKGLLRREDKSTSEWHNPRHFKQVNQFLYYNQEYLFKNIYLRFFLFLHKKFTIFDLSGQSYKLNMHAKNNNHELYIIMHGGGGGGGGWGKHEMIQQQLKNIFEVQNFIVLDLLT